ncbi:HAD hydrolase-like protein [Salmonella enterica subsp. enterica serovar Weltevreden]
MYARYAGLIFDMDGTLLDTEPTHRKAWREVLGRYGLRFDEQNRCTLFSTLSVTYRVNQFHKTEYSVSEFRVIVIMIIWWLTYF